MSAVMARAIATGVSAVAGVLAGAVTNMITAKWSWTWAAALVVAVLVLVASQVWISLSGPGGGPVAATAAGSVAAGDTVDADIDVETVGLHGGVPSTLPSDGVVASGPGSVAAGKNVKGKVKIRSRRS